MMTPAEVRADFASRAGSEQIATVFACEGLDWWIRCCQPHFVYEVGAGIGTLTSIIMRAAPRHTRIVAEEPEPWCRTQLSQNLPRGKEVRLRICLGPGDCLYDFLVVDGTTQSDHFRRLAIGGVVFIEGNRDSQLEALERTLDTRRWAKAHYRPADRSKGYTVYMMEAIWFERLWFAAVRLREYIRDVLGILHGIPLGKKVKI